MICGYEIFMGFVMKELLEHVVEVIPVIGSGYLLIMLTMVGGMLRAARRTSDDWEEYIQNAS